MYYVIILQFETLRTIEEPDDVDAMDTGTENVTTADVHIDEDEVIFFTTRK